MYSKKVLSSCPRRNLITLLFFAVNIVIIFCSASYAEERSQKWIDYNGTHWTSWTEDRQVTYLHGVMAGVNYVAIHFIKAEQDPSLRSAITNISVGELKKAIDLLYSEPANQMIELMDAVYLVKRYNKGMEREEALALLKFLRSGKKPHFMMYTDEKGERTILSFP